ncbi:putative esterase D [Rosellinia necatrix]|uniref:S-formylglutathione hydrolase n=1 Tax=Rosellinia necatrix TaxID=77044 RepID=A0A1W2TN29_ROSNE|nr:putative esterase D [Rosellinia necatrix]
MGFETKAKIATFGGHLYKLTHASTSTNTAMSVSVFVPGTATPAAPAPVLLYLSGLTCTPDNCSEKGFLHAAASRRGIAVVYPDTSPRGAGVAGEDDAYDFGSGAGFYVDAMRAPWATHYNMYSYVRHELLGALFSPSSYPSSTSASDTVGSRLDKSRVSITGHSMGGHGALTLYLKNPGLFRSVSAFAPIANPSRCPWGRKAFAGYLGDDDEDVWRRHDATELVGGDAWRGKDLRALIDVGTGDDFYKQGQLLPENFAKAVEEAGVTGVTLRYQPDYDHSYYFISSFAEDHVEHAAKHLFS